MFLNFFFGDILHYPSSFVTKKTIPPMTNNDPTLIVMAEAIVNTLEKAPLRVDGPV